jgi:hypothetical protein
MSDLNRRDILELGGLLVLYSAAGEVAWAQRDIPDRDIPDRVPRQPNDGARGGVDAERSSVETVREQNGLGEMNGPVRMRGEFHNLDTVQKFEDPGYAIWTSFIRERQELKLRAPI